VNTWKLDAVTGIGVIVFAIFILVFSMSFPAARGSDFGPALFPRVIASMLVVLGALLLFRARRLRAGIGDCASEAVADELTATAAGMRNVAVTIVAIVAYIAVVDRLGFIPTTLVFLFALMKTYGLTTIRSLVFSCLITGFVYVLFSVLLRVVLP